MPIEQVKLNAKKLKCPVPDTLKVQRGRIGLYRGKFARVEIWTSKGRKPLCVCRNVGGKTVREFFGLDEITYANDKARHYEAQGKANGERFGTISNDEKAALMKWRNYVWQTVQAGKELRSLAEIIGELIDREEHKDETPPLADVVFRFIEAKDAAGGISPAYRARIKNRLNAFARYFKTERIGNLNEPQIKDAILELSRGKDGNAPAPKTQKHYVDLIKELYSWFYKRENAMRRASEKLNNPLEVMTAPKIIKTKDPEILTAEQARAVLADVFTNDIELLPAVAVQMFCGVRNAEALRLRWRDMKDGEFHLSCSITKTKIARAVPVSENLRAWLDAYAAKRGGVPAPDTLIFPFNDTPRSELSELTDAARAARVNADYHARSMTYSRAILAAEKRTGFHKPQNAFRHTAVSCLAVLHGQNLAADWCGHSIRTQGVNYRGLMSKTEAKDYFGIMPPNEGKRAIVFSRERAEATRSREADGAGSAGTDADGARDGRGESAAL